MMTLVTGSIRKLYKDEDGLGTLEMILIIAILIAVAIIFKDQIKKIVEGLLKKADKKVTILWIHNAAQIGTKRGRELLLGSFPRLSHSTAGHFCDVIFLPVHISKVYIGAGRCYCFGKGRLQLG